MKKYRSSVLLAASLTLCGCDRGQSNLMPLQVGNSWTYHVTTGLEGATKQTHAVRTVAVAGVPGVELNGELGVSRMAWRGNALLADSTCNLRFSPPIKLLASNGVSDTWRGEVSWLGASKRCAGSVNQQPDRVEIGKQLIDTVKSIVVLHLPSESLMLTTWFEPGVGILKQEQSRTDKFSAQDYHVEIRLDLVEGP